MLEVLERSRLSDAVARSIRQYIAARGLRPGDRLPTEHALAEQLGVSRISVREATKALEFVGIVEAKPGRGLTVGQLDMGRISEVLGFHLAVHRYPPLALLETRIVVETGGLPYAARRIAADPAIHDRLQEMVERSRRTRELQEWIDQDIGFHRALLEASGLSPLVAFNDLLQAFFQRFRESVKKAEWKRGVESHQRIIDSLREQDLPRACDELRRHIESHKERVGVPS
jgi:DNA-binding FadR family transcriptional regulator